MSNLHLAGLTSMPEEIQDQIIKCIPAADLPSVMLTTRALSRLSQRHLYRSVHYSETPQNRPYTDSITLNSHSGILDEFQKSRSARIGQPCRFLRSIEEDPRLASYVTKASLLIPETGREDDFEALKKCLAILNPRTLELILAKFNPSFGLLETVTTLDIMYPAEDILKSWRQLDSTQNSLREKIYRLFSISSLRHLTLRDARCWDAFSTAAPVPSRIRSSNIISLSLPNTVPIDVDLAEILTWPKALKYYFHESEEGYRQHFQIGGGGRLPSAEYFLQSISAQSESLEEVNYNHGEDCCGDDGTQFNPSLMKKFVRLKYLSVPRECLVDDFGGPHLMYTVLPPHLQVLRLDQNGWIGDLEYEARLKEWLQGVVGHKESCFPSLDSVILVESEDEMRAALDYPEVLKVLDRM